MFSITCNAIGDIIAVVQLIRDIVVALNDAHGAAEEYKQFVYVLKALGTVLAEVYNLAKASQNESLCQVVLEEVQRCCIDINSAHNSITNFEKLEETSTRSSRGARAGLVLTKLRWHFMRASYAAKYAKRFSESHHRLNSYIGLLSHHSTSQLLGEQRYHALQVTHESRALRQSAEEMKAIALSTLQQVSLQSRQQVVEQAVARPFFASPQDRRVASRAQRVIDLIYDHLAPDASPAHRERFLSSLAPILLAGAAFLVNNNVSPQWHSTVFLPVICALVVQVMWLRSSTPVHPGFDVGNAIILVDFFGEKITVPYQFCHSSEMFHRFLDLLYSETQDFDAKNFVRLRLYDLYLGGTSQPISFSNWSYCILPGTCLEMGIVLIPDADYIEICPYCQHKYDENQSREVICTACSSRFWQTTETGIIPNWAGSWAGAAVLQRRHGTNFHTELSQMNAPLTSSLSVAQWHQSPSALPGGAVWRRCSRAHVVNLLGDPPYTPEDIQSGSKVLMDTLLYEETSGGRRSPGYELLRSYIDLIETYARSAPDDLVLDGMRVYKSTYDDAMQNIGGKQGYHQYFGGPMTVEEQLLTCMASTLDAFIAEPSKEGVRQWKRLGNGCSPESLSLDESQRVDELLKEHESIGGHFHRLCEYFNLQ